MLSGGCACGAIRYESTADPTFMLKCHCRDCQRASGSGYAATVVFPKATFAMRGSPRYHAVTGSSGHPIERGFCEGCGNPVSMRLGMIPTIIGVTAASLDDPSVFNPTIEVFTASAHPWDVMDPALPKKPRGMRD